MQPKPQSLHTIRFPPTLILEVAKSVRDMKVDGVAISQGTE
jgi:hypothetical protein